MAIRIRQTGANIAQIDKAINGPQQVILWDMILQRELIEQRRLRFLPRSHHRQFSHSVGELNQPFTRRSSKSFSKKSAHTRSVKFLLRALAARRMLRERKIWYRGAEEEPVIHADRSENQLSLASLYLNTNETPNTRNKANELKGSNGSYLGRLSSFCGFEFDKSDAEYMHRHRAVQKLSALSLNIVNTKAHRSAKNRAKYEAPKFKFPVI